MRRILEGLDPERVFYYFEEISRIPRGTGNEKAISNYLVTFANENHLEAIQDQVLNIIIKKPASPGYECAPTVILQGHMDMVCEKNNDSEHDFLKDPIRLKIDGDMIYAEGTTLGADNGIAVAYMLAILSSKEVLHPAIEALITVGEEGSMVGAVNVDPEYLSGRLMINMDAEKEGRLTISSAGGAAAKFIIDARFEDLPDGWIGYRISVKGLKGGHSGSDINKNRANANKLLARMLYDLSDEACFKLKSFNGGLKANAITRESESVIFIDPGKRSFVEKRILKWEQIFLKEYEISDPQLQVSMDLESNQTQTVFSEETKRKLIQCLILIPDGVHSMSSRISGLVESSRNLGIVKADATEITITVDIRSSEPSIKEFLINQLKCLSKLVKCVILIRSDYPGWKYQPESKLRTLFQTIYRNQYGKDPELKAIHAGLECGILSEKLTGVDIVAIGPNIFEAHTPYERLSITSVKNTYDFLLAVLENMKELGNEKK